MNLQVNEIFTSLSGEPDAFGNKGGLATFVRLQGCNLKCSWCDTKYTANFDDWHNWSVDYVLSKCNTSHVIITGGEPLLQKEAVHPLIERLVFKGYWVTIETNGTQPRLPLSPRLSKHYWRTSPVRYVVDYKLQSSGETHKMNDHVFDNLTCFDMVKFVIADMVDYKQALVVLKENAHWLARIVFSPVAVNPCTSVKLFQWADTLAKKMISDRLEFIQFSLQLHKLVNLR